KLTNQSLNTAIEQLSSYNEPKGEIGLRIEIMKYLNQYRGIRCNPEQIIICSGTQPCLNLLCQLFKNDFNHLAMEDPGYDGARYVFENLGYQVIPIDVKRDGIDITQLARTSAKLLYITPSHQFPMGCVTSIQKRLKLLDWAVKNEGIIIEDDYDSELRYSGRPIPSLQCNDFNERVVYIGTFSKSLSPALRMSYMVLPKRLLNQYNTVFTEYESSVPWLNQKTLELFMREGHWENHLRKICLSNKKKHDLLVKTIEKCMGDRVTVHGKNAGLHILLEVHSQLKENELIEKARNKKIKVYPVSQYWIRQHVYDDNFIMLGFSSLTEKEIIEGIPILKEVWLDETQK
ncbi:MAG: PLP-dependent aminotransferase family protein, partial [Clostridia bacterium]|nr:PLP-dependent aminotransferase family protein [Clostridia bacterium]